MYTTNTAHVPSRCPSVFICECSSLELVVSTHRHSAHPASVPMSHPRERSSVVTNLRLCCRCCPNVCRCLPCSRETRLLSMPTTPPGKIHDSFAVSLQSCARQGRLRTHTYSANKFINSSALLTCLISVRYGVSCSCIRLNLCYIVTTPLRKRFRCRANFVRERVRCRASFVSMSYQCNNLIIR